MRLEALWGDWPLSAVTGALAAWLAVALIPIPEQREPRAPTFRVTLASKAPERVVAPTPAPPAPAVQSATADPVRPAPDASPLHSPKKQDEPAVPAVPAPAVPDPATQDPGPPPSPDDDAPLPPPGVKPGGSTLVLAVKVDHLGVVHDLKILVPSGDAIANLTYGLALQSRPLKLNPPVPEGQTRWIEVPVNFATNDSVLP